MPYNITPVAANFSLPYRPGTGFPDTFPFLLFSAWFEFAANHSGFQMQAIGNNPGAGLSGAQRGMTVNATFPTDTAPRTLTIGVGDGNSYGSPSIVHFFGQAGFDMTALAAGNYYNILVSVDGPGNLIQCYVNDVPLPPVGSQVWYSTSEIAAPTSGTDGSSNGTIFVGAENTGSGNPCSADPWWGNTPSFVDLSVTANRRKFINADLTPVFLGDNGEIPFGAAPPAYASIPPGGVPSDFLTNRGTAGLFFTASGAFELCTPPTPPAGVDATVAELFFTVPGAFIDLTVESNRRNFISLTGGAPDLGVNGAAPFGVTPPVYLSRRGGPATFAANNGRGGAFIISGGTLTAGATNPPGVTTSSTTPQPFSPGQGLLGDYRNGNLYAFNPATYTDDGTRRIWLRRWRALAQGGIQAKSFHYLAVSMETGIGVLDAESPQVMLRWSDDGGHSWSNYRILPVGRKGATKFTVKANRLGATRRFSGSDRIFEMSSTDPFKVAILDADVDVS